MCQWPSLPPVGGAGIDGTGMDGSGLDLVSVDSASSGQRLFSGLRRLLDLGSRAMEKAGVPSAASFCPAVTSVSALVLAGAAKLPLTEKQRHRVDGDGAVGSDAHAHESPIRTQDSECRSHLLRGIGRG